MPDPALDDEAKSEEPWLLHLGSRRGRLTGLLIAVIAAIVIVPLALRNGSSTTPIPNGTYACHHAIRVPKDGGGLGGLVVPSSITISGDELTSGGSHSTFAARSLGVGRATFEITGGSTTVQGGTYVAATRKADTTLETIGIRMNQVSVTCSRTVPG